MFSIKGNSGCIVELIETENKAYVKKSTSDKNYFQRLKNQSEKQKNFAKTNKLILVDTPTIINECFDLEERCSFDMELCRSVDVLSYLQSSSLNEIYEFSEAILKIVEQNISNSNFKKFDKKSFLTKYENVKNNISKDIDNLDLSWADDYFKSLEEKMIPVGECHGDLTFSNVLVQKTSKKIFLIDFLDSFIETPLNDIVKLRQDTKFFWSLNLYEGEFLDLPKCKMILRHLDEIIVQEYKKYDFYLYYYKAFELLNLLRVLQYCKDRDLMDFILKHIKILKREI